MSIMQHSFEETRAFDENQPKAYRAILRNCGRGGVELSVFVPDLSLFATEKTPVCYLPHKEMDEEERAYRDAANARRAAQRARQSLRLLLKTMGAKYLWTFTWRDDVDDLQQAQKTYRKFVLLLKKYYPENKFVTVPERHSENRTSWHLHSAVADRLDVHLVRKCWWEALGHTVEIVDFEGKRKLHAFLKADCSVLVMCTPDQIRGNVDVKEHHPRWGSGKKEWDADKLAAYLSKYMDKTFTDAQLSARRFWPSKDCKRPSVERFWLMSTNIDDALRESYAIVKELHGTAYLNIFLSQDCMTLWISGTGCAPPF